MASWLKIEEFCRTLATLETELNQQVYALFELTPEEIALIEEKRLQFRDDILHISVLFSSLGGLNISRYSSG
jgi:hypothetical protein